MDLIERATRLLLTCEPSVSGSHGHNKLLGAAVALVQGFGLQDALAERLLIEVFNPRCSPVWSERDIKRKVSEAHKVAVSGPVGYLLNAAGSGAGKKYQDHEPARHAAVPAERLKKEQAFDPVALKAMMSRGFTASWKWLAERSPVDPRGVTPTQFLDVIRQPGEKSLVFYNFYQQGEYGHRAPGDSFRVGQRPNVPPTPVDTFPSSGRVGAWYLANPVDGRWYPTDKVDDYGNPILSRRSGRSLTSHRYMLLESDTADADDWLNALIGLPLPIKALYTSGDRSIHALVQVMAESKSQFDFLKERLGPLLSRLGGDLGAISGVRLTRLPGVMREGTEKHGKYLKFPKPELQRLLWLNPDPEVSPIRIMVKRRDIVEVDGL